MLYDGALCHHSQPLMSFCPFCNLEETYDL
jgi:hypothetical protein